MLKLFPVGVALMLWAPSRLSHKGPKGIETIRGQRALVPGHADAGPCSGLSTRHVPRLY